ncbi:HAE1 family hydrophobic/amphiphilic exporter-1 [Gracilibacillus halotolerans]|uniref:HAE1 family hydrophobic/amphiphilic exporter-1 n=1 Tax=Gracilibacillus halotolerans TaxID=74386 RepID=A0A841RQB0_9BACI|nr:efflux RND transporter permease subunit [Gracilibacillus halotolerans]MBB6513385.1 HAE1 family hydrophobic/amphiphilic exporter-1 [Gracilibacillus halotolerans]
MIEFIVKRKILIGLATILIILLGSYGLSKLDEELLPEVNFDGTNVMIYAGDMPAAEVERKITTPVEQAIQGIELTEDIYSTTTAGLSTIQVMIQKGHGEEVSQEIASIVHSITSNIPEVNDVIAEQLSTGATYEFYMDVSGGTMDEMNAFATEILEPRLESLPEVRDVMLVGLQEHEVIIELHRESLQQHQLSPQQIISIIQEANTDSTLGQFSEEDGQPVLRWQSDLENESDIENIQIPTETGFISLEELADVSIKPVQNSSYVWKNGSQDFVLAQVGRNGDYTQIDMAAAVREELRNIKEEGLLGDLITNEIVAQADYVEDSINGVTDNVLIGGLLAILVLFIFLRNLRATLIIAISIPTSILLTFLTIWLLDYSFNILSLISLGLGIGMMVDASIVILESIYKKKEEGLEALEAVVQGTKEVASAVIASMLTTIVVFVPIGLMDGENGQFMVIISVIIAITLISSVIVSFTLIPALSEKFLKQRKKKKESRIIQHYGNFIGTIVKKKRYSFGILVIFLLMFIGSLFLISRIPTNIMPDMLNRYSELSIDLETGVSSEEKKEMIQEISHTLANIEDIESSYMMDNGSNIFAIINMTKGEEITRDQKLVNEEVLRRLRELQDHYPMKDVQSLMSANMGSSVQVQLEGEEFDTLQEVASNFSEQLAELDGVSAVSTSIDRTSIEKIIELNNEKINDAGLNQEQVKYFTQEAFLDMPLGEIGWEETTMPLSIRWQDPTSDEQSFFDLEIPTVNGPESLSTFVEWKDVHMPNEITHFNGERYVTISADVENMDLGTINREIQQLIKDFSTPAGYSLSVAGDLEVQQELIMDLLVIFFISIFLVYLVMAVQFNHLAHPLIVMSIIPMTVVGVILGLFITQQELNVMSGMGIIVLIGIVLNNAILLIDRANQLRRQGISPNVAIATAGMDRIRPIFMTTLTTIGGMLPLALANGTDGNYQAPMAIAIVSGLLFSTLITLVLIPAVYRAFNALGNLLRRVLKDKRTNKAEEKIAG